MLTWWLAGQQGAGTARSGLDVHTTQPPHNLAAGWWIVIQIMVVMIIIKVCAAAHNLPGLGRASHSMSHCTGHTPSTLAPPASPVPQRRRRMRSTRRRRWSRRRWWWRIMLRRKWWWWWLTSQDRPSIFLAQQHLALLWRCPFKQMVASGNLVFFCGGQGA